MYWIGYVLIHISSIILSLLCLVLLYYYNNIWEKLCFEMVSKMLKTFVLHTFLSRRCLTFICSSKVNKWNTTYNDQKQTFQLSRSLLSWKLISITYIGIDFPRPVLKVICFASKRSNAKQISGIFVMCIV